MTTAIPLSGSFVLELELIKQVCQALPSESVVALWQAAGGTAEEANSAGDWLTLLSRPANALRLPLILPDRNVPNDVQRAVADALTKHFRPQARSAADTTFISYARDDSASALAESDRLRATQGVFIDQELLPGQLWPERLIAELLNCSRVHVVWSKATTASNWVAWEIQFARGLQRLRSGGLPFDNRASPTLFVARLDNSPLPPGLRDVQASRISGSVDVVSLSATVGSLIPLVVLASARRPSWYAASLLCWGIGLVLLQFCGVHRLWRLRARLERAADWLHRATSWEVLVLSENILDKIYGRRLVSLRSLLVSACASLLWSSPALCALAFCGDWTKNHVHFPDFDTSATEFALLLSLIYLATAALDFASLFATRTVIRVIHAWRRYSVLVLGLIVDLLIVGLLIFLPLWGLSLPTRKMRRVFDVAQVVIDESNSDFGWVEACLSNAYYLFAGELHVTALFKSLFPTLFVATGLLLMSAIFPSLVHLGLLSSAAWSHVASHTPLRWASRLLGSLAGAPRSPIVYAHAVLVIACTTWAFWPWPPKPFAAPIEFAWRDRWTGCVATTELTQAQWREVVDQAPGLAGDMALEREPSTFIGDDRPVENVTWCDALKFCNLLSHLERRPIAYCMSPDCFVRNARSRNDLLLRGCETQSVFFASHEGYNLARGPIPYHIQVIQRSGSRRWTATGWLAHNSGFQTHRVASFPTDGGPLFDVIGNVAEWGHRTALGGAVRPERFGAAWYNAGAVRLRDGSEANDQAEPSLWGGTILSAGPRERSGQTGLRLAIRPSSGDRCSHVILPGTTGKPTD